MTCASSKVSTPGAWGFVISARNKNQAGVALGSAGNVAYPTILAFLHLTFDGHDPGSRETPSDNWHTGGTPTLADVARARAPHREILYGRSNWAQQRQLQLQRTSYSERSARLQHRLSLAANPVRAEAPVVI